MGKPTTSENTQNAQNAGSSSTSIPPGEPVPSYQSHVHQQPQPQPTTHQPLTTPSSKPPFIPPSTFKTTINTKLDKPILSLYRLTIRLLQLSFALASGISYALDLSSPTLSQKTNFIYTIVVFVLTLLTLIIDAITIRYYRFIWSIEWTLCLLWFVVFALFFEVYVSAGDVEMGYRGVDTGRMKRAVWCDLINALLWMGSAGFSTAMCCAGTKAAVRAKFERRRARKDARLGKEVELGEMESGTVRG